MKAPQGIFPGDRLRNLGTALGHRFTWLPSRLFNRLSFFLISARVDWDSIHHYTPKAFIQTLVSPPKEKPKKKIGRPAGSKKKPKYGGKETEVEAEKDGENTDKENDAEGEAEVAEEKEKPTLHYEKPSWESSSHGAPGSPGHASPATMAANSGASCPNNATLHCDMAK